MAIMYNAFEVGNFRWSEMLFWITLVFVLAFGLLLFVAYMNDRNQSHLLWSVAFFGIVAVIYNVLMYTNASSAGRGQPTIVNYMGDYALLMWPDMQQIPYVIINALMYMTPGLIAAGLLLATFEDKKYGNLLLMFNGIMVPIIMVLMVDPTNGANADIGAFASLAVIILHTPSYLAIILLPILRNQEEKEGYLVSVAGLIMAVCGIIFVVMVFNPYALSQLEGGFVDTFFMVYPFLMMGAIVFLAFGILIPKKWSFSIPGVEFAER
jgi:hypothetical protein